MNWPELEEIKRKADTDELTKKQANDFISTSWSLLNLIEFEKKCGIINSNYEEEKCKLLELSISIFKRTQRPDKEEEIDTNVTK